MKRTDRDGDIRIPCIAAGCGRGMGIAAWRKRFGPIEDERAATVEYVCQRHWSRVPLRMRAVYTRVRRRERRFQASLPAAARIWRRITRDMRTEEA